MTINPDDPRLTAYALGDLDSDQIAEVEAALSESEELRSEVQEIRSLASSLSDALRTDTEIGLTERQIQRIEQTAKEEVGFKQVAGRPLSWYLVGATTAAASILLAVMFLPEFRQDQPTQDSVTRLSFLKESGPAAGPPTVKDEEIAAGQQIQPQPKPAQAAVLEDEARKAVEKQSIEPAGTAAPLPQTQRAVAKQRGPEAGATVSEVQTEYRIANRPPIRVGGKLTSSGERVDLARNMPEREVLIHNLLPGNRTALDDRDIIAPPVSPPFNTEAYDRLVDNPFRLVEQDPLSTFSIDVDTASYSNVRRYLNQNQLPPKDAVRIEELINYFSYDYAQPEESQPFSVHLEMGRAPWKPENHLLRIGLKGREIQRDSRPASNLVFLLDVSGSMEPANKLPLLKQGMKLLVNNLGESDRVSVVVYAGASGLALPPTSGADRQKVLEALDRLRAGGSTNGGAGIELAYRIAEENFIEGGINRVILATDGDFNIGITNQGDLTRLIESKARSGVFLSVLGFGMGNYKDSNLEKLADKGNGNYAYIDRLSEARKVLVEEISGTLVTIAKDVKIQVEFNPTQILAYRLIGYENRRLRNEDFNDDRKDAGEIGAGHTVTVLYELVSAGREVNLPRVDPLRYQRATQPVDAADHSNELLNLKLRFKHPDGDSSQLVEIPLTGPVSELDSVSSDFKFASAVAAFGMLLRDSNYKGNTTFDSVIVLAEVGKGQDRQGYRAEFIRLVKRAQAIAILEEN